jgi:hypothetical protein
MKTIITSIVSNKNKVILLSLGLICYSMLSYRLFPKIGSASKRPNSIILNERFSETTVFLYVPNSTIRSAIRNALLMTTHDLFDGAIFDIYDIKNTKTEGDKKIFSLILTKKNPTALSGTINENEMRKKLIEFRNNSNTLIRDIVLTKSGNSLILSSKKPDGKVVQIYELKYNDLSLNLVDPGFKYNYHGKTTTFFKENSVIISYATNYNSVMEIISFMEKQPKFQNLGASVVFPSHFISDYSKDFPLEFTPPDQTLISKVYMKNITMSSGPSNKLLLKFALDLDNRKLPTVLNAKATLEKNLNILESVSDFSYSNINLTKTQIQLMEFYSKRIKEYLDANYVNTRLIPRIEGDSVKISSEFGLDIRAKSKGSRLNYFKENIICTIDL